MPAPEAPPGSGTAFEVDDELVRNVGVLVDEGQRGMVLNLVADLRPADLARIVAHLPLADARTLFDWIPSEQTADVLPELESALRGDLLDDLTSPEIAALLDQLETDDQADVLGDLAETDSAMADAVLPQLEDAADVRQLLTYGDETAGGLMSTEYVAVLETATVAEATEEVRRLAETLDDVYVVYTIDARGCFVGFVTLKRLLLAPSRTPLAKIAETDVVTVEADLDQEEVARIMERYDLIALPVVSANGHLLGRITIDDVVDVIREEAEEDLQRAVGITGDEEISSSIFAVSRGRLVWLLLGLGGAYISGLVIVGFEDALQVAPVLALFIPIVMAMAGNAGIQSSAIAVQGLASGDIWRSDLVRRIGKELGVALINGLVLSVALALIVVASGFGDDTSRLALTAGLALMVVIVLSTLVGATVPLALSRIGIDPALAMGPFITVSNDILGLTIFFAVATVLYL
ncbi:magnesium transporter [Rubricoccus marinus]|uniref:Magnesium transporter MgtE n=1 Tax=Rubricoccus marinus TaxID=716817 RepID=A0A259U3J1_9BACT|nr:magnesium transporter [Rubricoccus marinus]